MVDQEGNGRPHGSAWRALHAEGILWDGQVLVSGAGADLPLRLIATGQRLAFTKGGAFVLDVPREWLNPAPYLNPDGSITVTISSDEVGPPERLRLVIRDGRRLAVDLIAALNKSKPQVTRSIPIYVPDVLPEMPEPPMARGTRSSIARDRHREFDHESVSALDDTDFPPLSAAPARSARIKIDDDLPPAPVEMPLDDAVHLAQRGGNWSLQPIPSMSNRNSRHAKRSWAIRLSGLIILIALAAASGSGRLPTIPGRELASRIPDTAFNAPFTGDAHPTEQPSTVAQISVPTSTLVETPRVENSAQDAEPTTPPSETAISLGIGGEFKTPSTVPLTDSPEPTETSKPTKTPEPTRTPKPTKTATPKSGEAVEADNPDPTETPALTEEPTETSTPEPTATLEPPPTETAENTATSEPTEEQTAPPTSTDSATAVVQLTETPVVIGTPTVTSTNTSTPAPSPTATQTPTPTATVKIDFPAQDATLSKAELPEQAFTDGAFRFTVEGIVRGASIDEVQLTPVSGAEWVLVVLYAENWSDAKASLAVADFQLLSYGDFGVQGSAVEPASGVVADLMGLDPALGASDTASFGVGRGFRLALAYLVRPDATVLQLTKGDTTIDLDQSIGQPVDVTDLGPEPSQPELLEAKVTRVVDGITIYVESGGAETRLRYLGVTAPAEDACYAAESTAANASLVEGQTVYLERENKNRETGVGIVRDVWIVSKDGGLTLVSAELAAVGAVVANPIEPDVRFAGWIQAATEGAQFNNAGLWAACGGLQTPTPDSSDAVGATDSTTPQPVDQVIEQAYLRLSVF